MMEQAKLFSSWEDHVTYGGEGSNRAKLMKTDAFNAVLVGLEAGQKIDPHPAV
jgi:hypothetical protein